MEVSAQELEAVQSVEPQPTVAVIGYVNNIQPIAGADRIQLAEVDCADSGAWFGVVTKEINAGDKVLVLLQDALLPDDNPRWAFMAARHFRVRMARFKGVPSECVILPLVGLEPSIWGLGEDVGEHFGITKFSKPIPAEMAGKAKGNFPSFIPKTDEPNFQRVRDLNQLMDRDWYATVKYDGTSCTAYNLDGELHVCSRNLELEDGDNLYWNMARKYELARKVPPGYALQFEIIGPGVQGNPLGLPECEIRVFTLLCFGTDHETQYHGRVELEETQSCMAITRLPMAEIVATGRGPLVVEQLRKLSEIKYPNGRPGEGIVIRGTEARSPLSLKVINLAYKD